ncbi:twin-arginine translocase TatA/TatE family subunit [Deferribacteres bacterium DY0037]
MFGLGSQEIIIILLIAVVLFGAGKLPQIGEGMGKAIKNFKKAAKDAEDAVDITPEEDKKKLTESEENNKEA